MLPSTVSSVCSRNARSTLMQPVERIARATNPITRTAERIPSLRSSSSIPSAGRGYTGDRVRAVPHETVTLGEVEISALLDVDVTDEPIADAFPYAPADELVAAKATYPDIYGPDDVWRLRVRAWLVRHAGGVLLLDTGVGPETSPAMAWCATPGVTREALAEVGASPD